VALFGGFDLGWFSSSSALFGDDPTQVLNPIFGEGGDAFLADTVDPGAAVFWEHVGQLEEPVFVLAEQVGDVTDGEDVCDGGD
jgi:hypothetical protein